MHKEFEANLNAFLSEYNMSPQEFTNHEKQIIVASFLALHCLSHSLMNGGKKAKAVGLTKLSQAHTSMINQSEKIKQEYFKLTGEKTKYGVQTQWGSSAEQQVQIKKNMLETEILLTKYARIMASQKLHLQMLRVFRLTLWIDL